jgi:hypothetical protein
MVQLHPAAYRKRYLCKERGVFKDMMRDIKQPEVKDIAVAVVPEATDGGEKEWNVYLLNLKSEPIEGVLVSSKGYGELNGEQVKTSMLRHFLDVMEPKSFQKIEPIMENVFQLNNEFWVSFYIGQVMYDKKFIFLPETIQDAFFTAVPLIGKKGVMIS